jgi:hypothetical protein
MRFSERRCRPHYVNTGFTQRQPCFLIGQVRDRGHGLARMLPMRALEESDFTDGCPIGTVACEVASTHDEIRRARAAVFAVAGLEGAIPLARNERDVTAGSYARRRTERRPTSPAMRSYETAPWWPPISRCERRCRTATTHRRGRRVDRGIQTRRDGTPRTRPRRVRRREPPSRLCPHHRVGTGRAAGAVRRSRHQLPVDHRDARQYRNIRTPRSPAQPGGRFRRRLDVPRGRHSRRAH